VWIIQGAHNTIQNSYFYQTQSQSSLGYGTELDLASDNLIVNNIMQQQVAPFIGGSQYGNTYAYNYTINNFETASSSCMYLNNMVHDAGANYNLFEGNFSNGMEADDVHGSAGANTLFRNVSMGYDVGKSCTTVAFLNDPYNRDDNVIGNVFGTPGITLYYDDYSNPTQGASEQFMVYILNQPHGAVGADAAVATTLMRWGNYDSVTGAVRFCGNSSDTGWSTTCSSKSEVPTGDSFYPNPIPTVGDTGIGQQPMTASFAFSSKPSWWPSGKPWPAVGPDITGGNVGQCTSGTYHYFFATSSSQCSGGSFSAGVDGAHINSIPAMDCYLSLGGPPDGSGSALSFNASKCYAGGSASLPPSTPTLLSATVN
jgi:hypothetical protein